MLIVGARMKARNEAEIAIGWQVERFAREGKKMKPLAKYLEPRLTPEQQREQGARNVRAMFKRLAKKQKKKEGG